MFTLVWACSMCWTALPFFHIFALPYSVYSCMSAGRWSFADIKEPKGFEITYSKMSSNDVSVWVHNATFPL